MTECAEGLTPTPMHVLLSIIVVDTRREKIEIMTCYKYINSLFLVAITVQIKYLNIIGATCGPIICFCS